MRAEVLIDKDMMSRGARMIEAMIETAPIPVVVNTRYAGQSDLLLTYGTGHPVRRQWWNRHRASGRHCIGLDLGYWGAESMRVTIDTDHPPQWIQPEDPARWDAQNIPLLSEVNPRGHAVIVGMGRKSLSVHGLRPLQWEREAVNIAKARGLSPLLKLKRANYLPLPGIATAKGSMEEALKGAALVICRHSNAAIDACIAGVPVLCEDGAALALYRNGSSPSESERLEFLRSLAWWNYRIDEAALCWTYILNRLRSASI